MNGFVEIAGRLDRLQPKEWGAPKYHFGHRMEKQQGKGREGGCTYLGRR